MEFMILIHGDENAPMPEPGSPEFEQMMVGWSAYNQRLVDGGHWIAGANLMPSPATTTVRKAGPAEPLVTDGPFAETKEQIGGFYLIKAADRDEAVELASAIPLPYGAMEVRPVAFRPDGG